MRCEPSLLLSARRAFLIITVVSLGGGGWAACTVDLGVSDKRFACVSTADCIDGFVCQPSGSEPGQSVCVAAGGVDASDEISSDVGLEVDVSAPDAEDGDDGQGDTLVDVTVDVDAAVEPDADGDLGQETTVDIPMDGPVDAETEVNNCPPTTSDGTPLGASCGVGVCAGGTVVCVGDVTFCDTDVEAGEELCNGLDDDCDGFSDEDFQVGTGCDGDDPDVCANGVVECASSTTTTCKETGGTAAEICDGVDNDCDGQIDEDFALGAGCDGDDADLCANGVVECAPDGSGTTCNETGANVPEVCDGADNDCDGEIDENFPTLGDACDGPDTDLCTNGTVTCSTDGTGVVCGSESVTNIVDVCDGQDNDCDGAVDEDYPLVGAACDSSDSDECANGEYSCRPDGGGVECKVSSESVANIVDVCNGQDDDCDGAIDEDFPSLGQPCDGTDSDQCPDGVFICSGGGLACSDDSLSAQETCNGDDDDCDGQIDEGIINPPSNPKQSGACAGSVQSCVLGAWVPDYNGVPGYSSPETTCNDGVDNDCDGLVDNVPLTNPLYDGDIGRGAGEECGIGRCIGGLAVCTGGTVVCSTDSEATSETCNGIDDDCDGVIDNGCSSCGGMGFTCPPGTTCSGGTCLDGGRVYIPGGKFIMGCNAGDQNCDSDAPAHEVRLSPFFIDRYEISCADLGQSCSPANRAAKVGWSTMSNECASRGGQLCTEAQWEFAARATLTSAGAPGPERKYPWGDDGASCESPAYASHWAPFGNTGCDTNECDAVNAFADGVSFFGVYNMAGNVAEWTREGYSATYYMTSPLADPHLPVSPGGERVMRGGSYTDFSIELVSYAREGTTATGTSYTGARCCY